MSGGAISGYSYLLYMPEEILEEINKFYNGQVPNRIEDIIKHTNILCYEMYKLLKAIDYLVESDASEKDLIEAYNKFRYNTGCVCREED